MKKTRGEKFAGEQSSYQSAGGQISLAGSELLVLGFLLSIFIARGFSVPLGQAVMALEQVAGRQSDGTVGALPKDEVGRMASALNMALEKLRSTLQEVAASAANSNTSSQELAAAARANCQRRAEAGGQPGRDLGQPGRNHRRRPAKCRQRQAGQPVGDWLPRVGGKRPGSGFQRHRRHG